MRTLGYRIMGIAIALAVVGLLIAIPFSEVPGNPHLVRLMLEGYRIHLIPDGSSPTGYLVNLMSGDWLLLCSGVFLTGFVIATLGHVRRT